MWTIILIAALSGFAAVLLGASGAHSLDGVDAATRSAFETGIRLHMWHTLALLGVGCLMGWAPPRAGKSLRRAAWAFTAGIVGFSGPLYLAGILDFRALSWAVPAGGFLLLAGWGLLAWAAWQGFRTSS